MFYNVKSCRHVNEQCSTQFLVFSSSKPNIIDLKEGSCSIPVREEAMVIVVEEPITLEVVNDLFQYCILSELGDLNYVRHWPVVLPYSFITFLVEGMYQLGFPTSWKLLKREVDKMQKYVLYIDLCVINKTDSE